MRNIHDAVLLFTSLQKVSWHVFCRFVSLNLEGEDEEEGKLGREYCWDMTEFSTGLFASGRCRGAAVMCYIVNYVSV